ncbi:(2Fe-2S)-binding protein [Streptomyces sp. HNM0575]|uniref:2Fe-2S iron-sulfur cluster-binding protein n=1 Tax=Streptomyces sp. HNM0575 TaxID=2716338 RepID=UPI001F1183D9|nr:(2Fe-2S)-binding protein [Streptomyces sp. HNM0575]
MSNGSPHDPNAHSDGYGQGYADAYGGGYGEYSEYGGYGEYPEYGPEYGSEYGDYGDYGEQRQHHLQQHQQHPHQQHPHQQHGHPQAGQQQYASYPQDVSYPQEGWGGESDQDATAFVQLPAGPLPPPGAGVDAWGPLAAPGTGQGGYTPPPLDPAEVAGQDPGGQAVPPPAEGGPASGGQWAMPFGEDPAAYGQQQYGGQYEQHPQHPGQHDQQPGMPSAFGDQGDPGGQGGPGDQGGQGGAGPTGQGAAAALAGSHEARTRRPLGTGGGAATDEAEAIGPGPQPGGPAAPQRPAAQQSPGGGAAGGAGAPNPAGAHFAEAEAEAHARRQVPFDGHEHEAVPTAGTTPGTPGTAAGPGAFPAPGDGPDAYTARPHESDATPGAGTGTGLGGVGLGAGAAPFDDGGVQDGRTEDDGDTGEGEARPMGTVRSGLPFTPSSGTGSVTVPDLGDAGAAGDVADTAGSSAAGSAVADAGSPPDAARFDAGAQDHGPEAHIGTGTGPGAGTGVGPDPAQTRAPDAATREPAPEPGERGQGESATDAEVSEEPPLELAPELGGEHPHVSYVLHVNGVDRPVTDAWIGESLLYVLRERLGLAGAKDGCSQGECGACSVQVDGRLVASCLVPAATAAGSEIRTVEGLAAEGVPSDVQRALTESGAVQCGFCVPGLAMTVHDLLEGNHAPSELETRKAICGNLCRCSGYRGVLDAVRTVVAERAEQAAREEAEAEAEAEAYERELAEASARIPHQASPGGTGQYPGGGGA